MVKEKKEASGEAKQPPLTDGEEMWAKCLAMKMHMMSDLSSLEFKVKVDTLALEHIKMEKYSSA